MPAPLMNGGVKSVCRSRAHEPEGTPPLVGLNPLAFKEGLRPWELARGCLSLGD